MKQIPRKSTSLGITILLIRGFLCIWPALAYASDNQITSVFPDSAERGTTSLLITFRLDTDDPPPPPAGMFPDSVMIGTISGSSVTHDSQYEVTAEFDIPASELTGAKDCSVVFTTPNGSLTFGLADGFEVTAPDAPPVISTQPQSQIVRAGETAVFSVEASGTEPLTYQWFKDGDQLSGETGADLTLAGVSEDDEGLYTCVVDNSYGSDTSDEATLGVDISVAIVEAAFPVVDSMQELCYDNDSAISCPASGQAFAGQDAQHQGYQAEYTPVIVGGDAMVVDEVTGLTWMRSPDTNGDGVIDADDKLTLTDAMDFPDQANAAAYGGFSDWRLPSIKELYSLFDSRGTDPSSETGTDTSGLKPFIDDEVFDFAYGDTDAGDRIIDSQWATTTTYVFNSDQMFGVNFADGRIKGYGPPPGSPAGGNDKTFYVILCRGNTAYGVNDFVDNFDGTVTDRATGLMWEQADSGQAMTWEEALNWATIRSANTHLGYSDWRVPDLKEMQSILDYTRSPDTHGTAAIDPVFDATSITNEECIADYPWYWTSSTHVGSNGSADSAAYLCFGRALGNMNSSWADVHGAGAQRSDSKDGDLSRGTFLDCGYYNAEAPQGDVIRSGHFVRLVRGGEGPLGGDFEWQPETPSDGETITLSASAHGGTSPYSFSWQIGATSESGESLQTDLEGGNHEVVLTITDAAGLKSTVTREITVDGGANGPVFEDGFESATTDEWSSTQ